MIPAHEVNAVTLCTTIHDGSYNATWLWTFREEVSHQDRARAGEPTVDQEQQLLKFCPATVKVTDSDRGRLWACRGASCAGIAARPGRFHARIVA
jgi:hypothetical protein